MCACLRAAVATWSLGLLMMCACQRDLDEQRRVLRRCAGEPDAIPPVEWSIELSGSGLERPRGFTYQELAHMEMMRLEDVLQQMTHFPDQKTSWRGPALDGLLAEARIQPGPMMITLEAADGYRVQCTREELASAIVALQDGEGRWLAAIGTRRPVRLVPPHKTGDYWVSGLRRILVEPLVDSEAFEE
ncbi:MAG: molybdopterin-dependent oxidoreductase [Planctomycetota bacterium]